MFASQFLPRFVTTGILAAFMSFGGGDAANALYDVSPGEIPGKPGSIIRVWPLEGGGPGMGGSGGEAFRILYRSTDPSGRPIPVSGAIYIPGGAAPAGGRNIIAWAHPTSGVMPPCAPSLMPDVGGMMWNLPNMITQGYIVVATDYPGLGTDGIHPYLIGESEARSVLDSVRAAREMPNTGASNRFAVWGHSQGGHAALYTGEVAARYAPDLKLVGVAAAAPATYLVELFDADEATSQDLAGDERALLDEAGEHTGCNVVEPQAMPAFESDSERLHRVGLRIREDRNGRIPAARAASSSRSTPRRPIPGRGSCYATLPVRPQPARRSSSRKAPPTPRSDPEITKRFGEALCAQGVRVSFVPLPGVTHTFAARDSANAALNWMTERFRGAPAPSSCER